MSVVLSEARYELLMEAIATLRTMLTDAFRYGLRECEYLRSELVSERINKAHLRSRLAVMAQELEIAQARIRTQPAPAVRSVTPAHLDTIAQLTAAVTKRDQTIANLRETVAKVEAAKTKRAASVANHQISMDSERDRKLVFYRSIVRAIAHGDERIMALVRIKFAKIDRNYSTELIGPDGDFVSVQDLKIVEST